MLVRLTLENFLAHGHTVLELGPGLTVLTGPNNTGKSAVVEALRCLATNPVPKHFIRHGAREARVEAEFDDGCRVAWLRKEKYAGYQVYRPGVAEPEEFFKFGRKPPEAVLEILRLNSVQLENDQEVDVHIGDQKKPIFLLDNQAAMAPFFAASSESAHLLSMQKVLKDRVRGVKAEEKQALARRAAVGRDLDALAPLPGLELAMDLARERFAELTRRGAELPRLEVLLARVREFAGRSSELARRAAGLTRAAEPPVLLAVAALAEVASRRVRLVAEADRLRERRELLERAAPPPLLAPLDALSSLARGLAAHVRARACSAARAAGLAGLADPPALAPLAALSALAQGIAAHVRLQATAAARSARLAGLAAPPALAPLAPIAALARGIGERKAVLTEARSKAAKLAGLAEPPVLFPTDRLTRALERRRSVEQGGAALAGRSATLARLTPPPTPASAEALGELARLARDIRRARKNFANLLDALEAKGKALDEAKERISGRLAEAGSCPLCGAGLDAADAGRFLGNGLGTDKPGRA